MKPKECFLAGANSIFSGDKLLTTPNPGADKDSHMFDILGLKPMNRQNVMMSPLNHNNAFIPTKKNLNSVKRITLRQLNNNLRKSTSHPMIIWG